LAPVALRAPYAKSLNPPTPLLPCKLNPKPHTAFGPNVGTRSGGSQELLNVDRCKHENVGWLPLRSAYKSALVELE
jgi:hypothetical protein